MDSRQLRISSSKGPSCVCAISTIESIFRRYGLNTLDRTLRLCVASWEGKPDSLTANIIKGIALRMAAFGDSLHDDRENVGKFSSREISRSARERGDNAGKEGSELLGLSVRYSHLPPRIPLFTTASDCPLHHLFTINTVKN